MSSNNIYDSKSILVPSAVCLTTKISILTVYLLNYKNVNVFRAPNVKLTMIITNRTKYLKKQTLFV